MAVADTTAAPAAVIPDVNDLPTLTEARRLAAQIVARDSSVCEVLLFGSVAEGTQQWDSDYDFVVVLDDIDDYRTARKLLHDWKAFLRDLTQPYSCDVIVHDAPSWKAARSLTSSFERSFASVTSLYRREPLHAKWKKDTSLMASHDSDFHLRLTDFYRKIVGVHNCLVVNDILFKTESSDNSPNSGLHKWNIDARLGHMHGYAHELLELSCKLLLVTSAADTVPKTHSPLELAALLTDPAFADTVTTILEPLLIDLEIGEKLYAGTILNWHLLSTYATKEPVLRKERTLSSAAGFVVQAVKLAEYTLARASEFPIAEDSRYADECREVLEASRECLTQIHELPALELILGRLSRGWPPKPE